MVETLLETTFCTILNKYKCNSIVLEHDYVMEDFVKFNINYFVVLDTDKNRKFELVYWPGPFHLMQTKPAIFTTTTNYTFSPWKCDIKYVPVIELNCVLTTY